MVYSKWRGIKYVRQHVIPANPRTTAQTLTRSTFAFLRSVYKFAGPELTAAWNAFAQGRPFTGMNKFVGENIRLLRGMVNLDAIEISPGAKGGLPASSITLTSPLAGEILVDITLPALPSGWTMAKSVAVAIHQQDPSGIFDTVMVEGEVSVTPWTQITLTGLTTGDIFVVGVFLVQNKPDGTLAYSVSLVDEVTVS